MVNYISVRQVMDDILDSDIFKNLNFERAINYAVRFIERVGIPSEFEEKTEIIHVDNYRALIPCDFYEVIQVRLIKVKNDCKKENSECGFIEQEIDTRPIERDIVFRETTDSFHMSNRHRSVNDQRDLTYKIQNNIMFTSLKQGDIELAYRALKVDKDGFPLIPDNSSFIEALECYIKKEHGMKLLENGKIDPRIYEEIKSRYAWAVGQASADLIRPDTDKMEAITNMWNRLIPAHNEHNKSFVHTGTRQYWRVH